MFAIVTRASARVFSASLSLLCACAFAQSNIDGELANSIAKASPYPEAFELRQVQLPSSGEIRIYAQLLNTPAHQPLYLPKRMVDRSVFVNVLREGNALPLLRLWSSTRSHLYFGVGPDGLTGLNFSQKRKISEKKKKRVAAIDYSTRIRELLAEKAER